MGDHLVHTNVKDQSRSNFIHHLLDDLNALQYMLDHNLIESGIRRIGAEQEFCLIDENWRPSDTALEVLKDIDDTHFTTELATYNLEINLDPLDLKKGALLKMQETLFALLSKANKKAKKHNSKVLLSGILPSISKQELSLDHICPDPRYKALNERMKSIRGSDFQLHLSGVDELSVNHSSVMFEACNTSFQIHLQVDPQDFIDTYNWAQAISGPLLGISTNSPILLGKELWHETRIALFQQSIDTRPVQYEISEQGPRVTFGDSWAEGSLIDFFKNEISRYQILLTKDIQTNSLEELKQGKIPKLKALNLHNGTIYRWNRACYGAANGKAHVRIENRYLPAGPSVIDQMANFAFWVGLIIGKPKEYNNIHQKMDFKDVKNNFIKAAQHGANTVMCWMNENVELKELINKTLLPIAHQGLKDAGIPNEEINQYLQIIEKRVKSHTGSEWMIKNYRSLKKTYKQDDALLALTQTIYQNQLKKVPVHSWENAQKLFSQSKAKSVEHIMSRKLFTARQNDNATLTLKIMKWNHIHHMPVVNNNGKLTGLLTWNHLKELDSQINNLVEDIMIKDVIATTPVTTIQEARDCMLKNKIGCLPVIARNQLIGIITKNDL